MSARKLDKIGFTAIVFFALALVIACGSPEIIVTPEEQNTLEPDSSSTDAQFEWGGVTLHYDPQLILDIEAHTVSAQTGEEMYETAHPEYTQFNLVLDSGAISIVNIEDYKAVLGEAADLLSDVQFLIARKSFDVGGCIPELPLAAFYKTCEHQQFNANISYPDFKNGSGVRFVTVYGIHDFVPVSNENLVYIFQGITDDGKYYIKAGFRITNTLLEDTVLEFPPEIAADTDGSITKAYFAEFKQKLDEGAQTYQPALERFDAILQSIHVE